MKNIDAIMQGLPIQWRYYWCEAEICACLGCANGSGRADITKAEWEEWVKRNPPPNGHARRGDESMSASTSNHGACEDCRFAGPKRNYNDHECRRHAPEMVTVPHWQDIRLHVPRWPVVRSDDWCGDYVRRVNTSET